MAAPSFVADFLLPLPRQRLAVVVDVEYAVEWPIVAAGAVNIFEL